MTLVVEEAAVAADTDMERSDVQAVFDSINPPEGFRVELIGGAIVMSPSAVGQHGGLLRRLDKRFLDMHKPDKTEVSSYPLTVELPSAPGGREAYIPDLVVVDEDVLWDPDDWKFPADVFHLVVEVVSAGHQSRRDDREVKPMGYASGPIPLYLLIDPLRSEVTLFSEPENGTYRRQLKVPFGDEIPFPKPFDAALDTSIFQR